jgi:ketosteroid isomerase-like protein
MTAQDNKALVQRFLSQGVSSAESNELVTGDFKWIGPMSLDFMFEGDVSYLDKQALRTLHFLDEAIYKGYDKSDTGSSVHFMIAEDDVVVMEFDAAFTTFEGEQYHNQYCLVFTVRDGRIAQVREHVDSHYSYEVLFGTPEKMAGVMDRLARLRAGETI